MSIIKKVTVLVVFIISNVSHAETLELQQVLYQEIDPGMNPAPMRLLVSDDYFRVDGGNDRESFILLDRKKQKIISVNHEDRTVIHITPKNDAKLAFKNNLRIESQDLKKSPRINGIKAKVHMLLSNELLCRQVVSFEGLLPKVTQAWKEYETVIQLQNRNTLNRTPQDMRTECFMANNIIHAPAYLNYGLPFSVKSKDGNFRMLQNYSTVTKQDSIFSIPSDYQQINL